MQDKRSTAVERDQTQLGIEMEAVADVADGDKKNRKKPQTTGRARKDKRGLHTMRHAMLTRYPLQALARLGENVRHLRKIEREFRAELKPVGMVGQMLFDRMFSAYLRCLLAARAEAIALIPIDQENVRVPGPDAAPGGRSATHPGLAAGRYRGTELAATTCRFISTARSGAKIRFSFFAGNVPFIGTSAGS